MNVSCSEGLNDTVDLLRLAREADIHEQLSYRNIERVSNEVEALNICAERTGVESVGTGVTIRINLRKD